MSGTTSAVKPATSGRAGARVRADEHPNRKYNGAEHDYVRDEQRPMSLPTTRREQAEDMESERVVLDGVMCTADVVHENLRQIDRVFVRSATNHPWRVTSPPGDWRRAAALGHVATPTATPTASNTNATRSPRRVWISTGARSSHCVTSVTPTAERHKHTDADAPRTRGTPRTRAGPMEVKECPWPRPARHRHNLVRADAAQVNSSRIRSPMIDTTSKPGTTMIARVPT